MAIQKPSFLLVLVMSTLLSQLVVAALKQQQQQVDPKPTPGYDATAAVLEATETSKNASIPAVATATNAYEGDVAADVDSPFSQEDLETMFKPIYSSTDESTHAGASHGSQHEHMAHAATVEKGSSQPSKVTKSGHSGAVGQAQQPVSIDDLMLGLDGSDHTKKHQESAPNQYESEEAVAEEPEANMLLESGMQGGKAANKYITGPSAPGAFVGGPSLVKQHEAWRFDNPETSNDVSDGRGTFVAAAGGPYSGLNHNLLASLNNDLSFLLYQRGASSRKEKARRRQLLQDEQDPDTASAANHGDDSPDKSNSYERELTDADEEVAAVLDRAEYAASAFELPATAVQAAKVQMQELRQLLAANRVPKIQFEQEGDQDAALQQAPDTAAATAVAHADSAHTHSSRSHRKLFATPDTAAQLLSSKAGRGGKVLWGVTYSWRRSEACDGGRFVCRCPHPDDLEVDIDLLYKYSNRIRTYSVECPDLMRMLLHHTTANPHVTWLLGVWVGKDAAANQAQIDLLGKLLSEFPNASLSGIVVGNEAISRRDVTQEQLIEAMAQVRGMVRAIAQKSNSQTLPKVPIMTAELPVTYTAELAAAGDVLGANIQPFYSGSIDTADKRWVKTAAGSTMQQYTQLQDKFKGKQVVVTEVGWPTKSGEMDTNRASTEHAAAFAKAWVQAAEKNKVPYFYHELADAAWKTALRKGAAAAARAGPNKGAKRQPGLLSMGVLADEHFGLVSADRQADKGLLKGVVTQK